MDGKEVKTRKIHFIVGVLKSFAKMPKNGQVYLLVKTENKKDIEELD